MFGAFAGSTMLPVSGMQWRSPLPSPSTAACFAEALVEVLLHSAVSVHGKGNRGATARCGHPYTTCPAKGSRHHSVPLKAAELSTFISRWGGETPRSFEDCLSGSCFTPLSGSDGAVVVMAHILWFSMETPQVFLFFSFTSNLSRSKKKKNVSYPK